MIFYLSSASLLESSFSLFDGPAGGATDEADVGPLLEGDGVAGAGEWSSGSLKSWEGFRADGLPIRSVMSMPPSART